jgi:AP-1-like factor
MTANADGLGDLFSSPPDFDSNFVGDYRDPLFDGEQFTLPELVTSEYSMFDPIENPIANSTFDALEHASLSPEDSKSLEPLATVNTGVAAGVAAVGGADDETVPAPTKAKLMTCNAVWDRICSHPKFGDIDIDGLCSELRSKAKCSDTGVLLTEKDVDKVLSNFS